jgi:hypothetical protein
MHYSALTLVVLVCGAVLAGGYELGAATAVAGLAVLLNLEITRRLTQRLVRSATLGDDPAAAGVLILKQLTVLPVAVCLAIYVGLVPLVIALSSLLGGTMLLALVGMLQRADAASLVSTYSAPQESRC